MRCDCGKPVKTKTRSTCLECLRDIKYRCIDCDCRVEKGDLFCTYCAENPLVMEDRCIHCNGPIAEQTHQRWMEEGNWCHSCLCDALSTLDYFGNVYTRGTL